MKLNVIVFLATSVIFASCTGCSKSGSRPTGPKTFMVLKVLAVNTYSNNAQTFIADTSGDGKADMELTNRSIKQLQKNDSVTVVLQDGSVTRWYK